MQTSNVVIDVAVSDAYEAQPGRQERLTVIRNCRKHPAVCHFQRSESDEQLAAKANAKGMDVGWKC